MRSRRWARAALGDDGRDAVSRRRVHGGCGDGGFMMNSQEMETAVRLKLNLVVLVLEDYAYGMIRWKQAVDEFADFGLTFGNPDFVRYAEAMARRDRGSRRRTSWSRRSRRRSRAAACILSSCPSTTRRTSACWWTSCLRPARSAAVRAARLRNHRFRKGVDQRRETPGASAFSATPIAITMNRERLMADAKAFALERVARVISAGAADRHPRRRREVLAALKLGVHLAWRAGRISDHDAVVGRALANVLAGGALPHQTTVSEQYLLDLEREAFLKLCGERRRSSGSAHAEDGKASQKLRICGTDRSRRRTSARADPGPARPVGVHAPDGRRAVGVLPRVDVFAR